jgi:UDP-glucose 4-epimerase
LTEKKTILITGGCGYIGSHTAIDLLEKGFSVISIDNLARSKPIVADRIRAITGRDFYNYPVDCRNLEQMKQVLQQHGKIDGIIHFAALKSVGESVKNPLAYYDNNIQSTINILHIADAFAIPHFVFSSSCSVYGNTSENPVLETAQLNFPESPYGWTKLISEQIIESHAHISTLHCISLRYFNPAGAHPSGLLGEIPFGEPENLVPAITQAAIGKRKEIRIHGADYPTRDGSCIRDYIHVMDIAGAHALALQYLLENKSQLPYEVFNLGTGYGVSVLEMIHAFEKTNNIALPYVIGPRRPGDVTAVYADNKKAMEKLGWKIQFNLHDIMRTAWRWEQHMQSEHVL